MVFCCDAFDPLGPEEETKSTAPGGAGAKGDAATKSFEAETDSDESKEDLDEILVSGKALE